MIPFRRIEILDKRTGETIHASETPADQRLAGTYWSVHKTEPQLRLRCGETQLEISFGAGAAEASEEPADDPPAAPEQPVENSEPDGTP